MTKLNLIFMKKIRMFFVQFILLKLFVMKNIFTKLSLLFFPCEQKLHLFTKNLTFNCGMCHWNFWNTTNMRDKSDVAMVEDLWKKCILI